MAHDVSLVVYKMYETTFTISASIFGFPCEKKVTLNEYFNTFLLI